MTYLSSNQLKQYEDKGFVSPINIFSKEKTKEIRDEIAIITPPSFQRFPQSFSHIFAGGYSAGYYSYKWAEVLSADCYSMFENKPAEQQSKLGQKFLKQILSKGGSRPALESFLSFMNRDPSIDALLRHSGLEQENQ